jgi:hypothetical protein
VTTPVPTFSQIKAQVAAIQQKSSSAYAAIGIHAQGRWTGAHQQEDNGNRYLIYQCDSPLAFRLALRDPVEEKAVKVLITGLDEQSLDQDILLRLAKSTLFSISSWQIAKSLFGATIVDPRLLQHPWIADTLLEWMSAGEYPIVNGGFLDAETVWPILLRQGIGLAAPRPDLLALVEWSINSDNVARYQGSTPEFRAAAANWLGEVAGATARALLTCVEACDRPDAVPVGLAAEVIFNPALGHQLDKAKGKLEERFLRGNSPSPVSLEQWSQSAAQLVRSAVIPAVQQGQLVQRADEILTELGAHSLAYLSTTSEMGFAQRLAQFGQGLLQLLASPTAITLETLTTAHAAIQTHRQAGQAQQQRRLEKVAMAMRLARWLVQETGAPAPLPQDLEQAVQHHLLEGGFLDWARLSLRSGDPISELSAAYQKLFTRVTAVRETQSHLFAKLLQNWVELGSGHNEFVPIETILDTIVAPLASQEPVLAVVLDGMSMAVGREIMANLQATDWVAITLPGQTSAIMAGLATIPSLTETSRTSLLCGQLTTGDQALEKKQFTTHSALVKVCRSKHPPLLFHKGDLQDGNDAGLTASIRDAINNLQNRVIGVVINAVDDYLAKGEQIDVRWTPQEVKVLPALLHEAKMAGRWVILLSDHGHVLDSGMTYTASSEGERWRNDTSAPTDQELKIQGPRVVIPDSHQLIAPWSEKLRYKPKKTGYHGGINPQEMVVPVAVLSPLVPAPKGWAEAPLDTPLWWHLYPPELPVSEAPAAMSSAPVENDQAYLGPLFSLIEPEQATPTKADPELPLWVSSFLESPSYQAQKQLAGRLAPDEAVLTRFLASFDRQRHTIPLTSLARRLNQSPAQLQQLMPSLQRIINIDGYAVLTCNGLLGQILDPRPSSSVTLNHDLLLQQFGLSHHNPE